MKHKLLSIIFLVYPLTFAGTTTIANQVEEKNAHKNETGTFKDDYLYMGRSLSFTGEAEDITFLGETFDFDGNARVHLTSFGKSLTFGGTIGNGLTAAGKDITINSQISGTNYLTCKDLHITETARIEGDLFTGCSNLTIDGPLKGNLYVGAGKITINNDITGNVNVHGGRLIITGNGSIKGNLTYETKEIMTPSEVARVSGKVKFTKKSHGLLNSSEGDLAAFLIFLHIFSFLSFVVIGVILLFLPMFKKIEPIRTPRAFWHTALWGLILIFMYPALIVISLVGIITIPFALLLALAFMPLFIVAYVIGATLAGQFIIQKFRWDIQKRHFQFLIGAGAAGVLSLIPLLDFLTIVLMSSLGWGVYITLLFGKKFDN